MQDKMPNTNKIDKSSRPPVNEELILKRYAQGNEKTWKDVVDRVSKHAANQDKKLQEEFSKAIYSGEFYPSRMAYMGTKYPFASSCFVFPIEDSLVQIMQTLSEACQVQKYGGGTGYNFSKLRPKGDIISTSGGEASGPISFMGLYHRAMEVVHRAGKKHAAQMGILNCDHPNIFEFIQCKDEEGAFWTFNISVAVTDKFLKAVKENANWDLKFEDKVYKTIKAKELWDYIIKHAHLNGDPGIIFIDTVNKNNKYPETIEACNPCGEQMLPPHVSCNLGSIDLSKFVLNGELEIERLRATVRTGIKFLDNSVQNAYWPVKKIQKKTRKYRNIGLGVMGWSDMLIQMGIAYDSEEAVKMGETVMQIINETADNESKNIGNGQRVNTTVTSIAPTGSISVLAGCSSGIEPPFGIVTMKNTYVGSFRQVHWIFEDLAKKGGFHSEELMIKIANEGSIQNLEEIPDNIKRLFKTTVEIDWEWHVKHQASFQKYTDNAVSKTINLANDATFEDVEQAYLMAYSLGCKSITVYRDGSRQVQVMDIKTTKRDMCPNCKAILFMNDGVKSCVTCGYIPDKNKTEIVSKSKLRETEFKPISDEKKPRPDTVHGRTHKVGTPFGKAYITVNRNGKTGEQPFEVFVTIGKAGSDVSAEAESLGRLISGWLRSSHNPYQALEEIVDELKGIGGSASAGFGPNKVRSLPDAISRILLKELELSSSEGIREAKKELVKELKEPVVEKVEEKVRVPAIINAAVCPDCGNMSLIYAEGCEKCTGCGYSRC